jgi:hypothetical protein
MTMMQVAISTDSSRSCFAESLPEALVGGAALSRARKNALKPGR